ncbi:hypothetical protein RHMOL_Rhmol10G0148200 [Rhododendron molle]|uniref:Uncharacterized protein n=1 Tax=Rhododendron molle TaxID=49168 RepID=A0ACC0M3H5_RHOML|nr:hypothetical protein RHMOL_Rhmol10G0148200 [Rhododendron molle]
MRVGGAGVAGSPRAAALPFLLHGRRRPTFRCYSSSSSDHVSFIKDVAATQPPEHLPHLLKMLQSTHIYEVPTPLEVDVLQCRTQGHGGDTYGTWRVP